MMPRITLAAGAVLLLLTTAAPSVALTVRGQVTPPLAGVLVSDGSVVTRTDRLGQFTLASHGGGDLVFVTVPAGYRARDHRYFQPRTDRQLLRFDLEPCFAGPPQLPALGAALWEGQGLAATAPVRLLGNFDPPYPVAQRDLMILRADVAAVNQMADRPAGVVYGGDFISGDTVRAEQARLWMEASRKVLADLQVPYYPLVGNHDLCWVEALARQDPDYAFRAYRQAFGPEYYSFDVGQFHFVVLNCYAVNLVGSVTAPPGLTRNLGGTQKQWLAQDLALQPVGKPIIIFAHEVPYEGLIEGGGWGDEEVWSILAPYRVVAMYSGHAHAFAGREIVSPVGGARVPCQALPASYGAKWIRRLNRDWTPRGWLNLHLTGTSAASVYGPAESDCTLQPLYPQPGQAVATSRPTPLWARICAHYPLTSVWCQADRREPVAMVGDPYTQVYRASQSPRFTREGEHTVTIGATDTRGRQWQATTRFTVTARPDTLFAADYTDPAVPLDGWDVALGQWSRVAEGLLGERDRERLETEPVAVAGAASLGHYRVRAGLTLLAGSGGLLSHWDVAHHGLYSLSLDPATNTVTLAHRKAFRAEPQVLDQAMLNMAYGERHELELAVRFRGPVEARVDGEVALWADPFAPPFLGAELISAGVPSYPPPASGRFGVFGAAGGRVLLHRVIQERLPPSL